MTNKNKNASTDYPILPVLAERWSPDGFADCLVAEADLRSCSRRRAGLCRPII